MSAHSLLTADDYRRVLAVVEALERAVTLEAFGRSLLAALDDQFGYRMSAFFVAGPIGERLKPEGPVTRGMPTRHAEGWHEYWGEFDPLNSAAAFAVQRERGIVDIVQLEDRLDDMQRRYVNEFLRPTGIESQLAFHVDTGLPRQGYGSLASGRGQAPLGPIDHARVLALRPHLGNLLRRHVSAVEAPAAARSGLSRREAEVANLVAQGLSNREIAAALGVSEATVKQHVTRLLAKMGVENRTQLALAWNANGSKR